MQSNCDANNARILSGISLELSEEVGVGAIWEELLTTSRLLCSTYLHINGVFLLKAPNNYSNT